MLAVHAKDGWAAAVALHAQLPARFGVTISACSLASLAHAALLDRRPESPEPAQTLSWLQEASVAAGVSARVPLLALTLARVRTAVAKARLALLARTTPAPAPAPLPEAMQVDVESDFISF